MKVKMNEWFLRKCTETRAAILHIALYIYLNINARDIYMYIYGEHFNLNERDRSVYNVLVLSTIRSTVYVVYIAL